MNKKVVYISIGVITVLLGIFGVEILLQNLKSQSTLSDTKTDKKQFYFYDDSSSGSYFWQNEEPKTKLFYTCETESCEILVNEQQTSSPYFLIRDGKYYLVDYQKKEVLETPIEEQKYRFVEQKENFAYLVKEVADDSSLKTFDIYFYNQNKVIELPEFEKDYKTQLLQMGQNYIIQNEEALGPTTPPVSKDFIYDENFNLISNDYYVYGFDSENNLIVAPEYQLMFGGGSNIRGYSQVKNFLKIDGTGKIVDTLPTPLSMQSFVYANSQTNQIAYYFAVDNDNILKLYDINGNVITSVEEWSDQKSTCIGEHPVYQGGATLTFAIGNGEENAKEYIYFFETNKLTVIQMDYPLCSS